MKTLDHAPACAPDCEARTVRTVLLRLIPFIVILYVFNLIGVTVDHTQSYKAGLLLTATSLMLGGVLTLLVKRLSNHRHAASNGESNP